MSERGALRADVRNCLLTATAATWQPDHETWKVTGGVDCEGDYLNARVVIEADVVIITIT